VIRRVLRRIRSDESGLSLTELLVSSMLTLGILAMVGNMFIQTAAITSQSTQTNNSNNIAANIANEVAATVRVATNLSKSGQALPDPAIVSGSRESLTLYSLSNTDPDNPAPVRVKYTINSDREVIEERCTGTASGGFWTFGSCASLTTRNLGGAVTALTGVDDQFFTYYTAANQPIVIAAGNLTATQRATVASIRIYVSVKADGSETKQAVISNTVFMGNLGLDQSE
jgi:Tfp pilus assembly protein PilV